MIQKNNNALDLYKRLLKSTGIYKKTFFLAIIGMVIHAITDTSFAAIIKPLLDGSFINKDPSFIQIMPILIILIFVFQSFFNKKAVVKTTAFLRNICKKG